MYNYGYFFLFQAILFYVPRWLWKNWEAGKVAALRMDLNLGIISEVEKKLKKKLLIEYMYSNLKHHNFWAYRYFFCELLSLINVCGKFYVPYPKEKIMCQSSLLDSANSISFQPFVYYTFLLKYNAFFHWTWYTRVYDMSCSISKREWYLYNAVLFWITNMMVVIYWLRYHRLKKALYYLNMFTLDILFRQITTFIKVCVAFVFGLQTL